MPANRAHGGLSLAGCRCCGGMQTSHPQHRILRPLLLNPELIAMSKHALLLFAFVLGVGVLALVVAALGKGASAGSFKAKHLLTANELEFLGRLEAAAPELRMLTPVGFEYRRSAD